MPWKPLKPCCQQGCSAKSDERFCPLHRVEQKRVMHSAIDSRRGSASERGYDAKWRRIRALFLKQNPLCVAQQPDGLVCNRPATDVDHIVPLRLGGSNQFINLQALCHSCHSRKTAREDGAFKRQTPGGAKSYGLGLC